MTTPTHCRHRFGRNYFFLLFLLVCGAACGPGSSPEGRLNMRVDGIQRQLDSLAGQHAALRDSLGRIHNTLQEMQAAKAGKQ